MKESNRDVTQTCIFDFLFDYDDNFSPIIPGWQSAVMITLVQVSQRLIVGHWSLIIIILLDPEFEIFPFEVVRAIIVLLWFFSYAFTYIDYPIAVLDLSIYHSSE